MADDKTVSKKDMYYNFSNTTPIKKDQYGKDTFLKILAAQLSNQDPMNSKDNSEYVAQMAQFSALEQMQNMNASMTTLLKSQKLTQATSLINTLVTVKDASNNSVDANVKSVKTELDKVYVVTDKGDFEVDKVINVLANQNLNNVSNMSISMDSFLKAQKFSEGAMFLNAEVEFKLTDGTISKELVKGVKIDNGKVVLVTENNSYSIDQVVGVGDTKNGK